MIEPVLEMEEALSGEGVLFLIVYGDHGTENKKVWRPCYKSEITKTMSTKTPYKYGFNEFCCQVFDLTPHDKSDDEFKIEFFRSQKNGKHKILGNTMINLTKLR